MIVNNITINIEKELEEKWLLWMKEEIIPQILAFPAIKSHSGLKLLNEIEGQGATYSFQFHFSSVTEYESSNPSPAAFLYNLHYKLYKDRFVLFETLLEQL